MSRQQQSTLERSCELIQCRLEFLTARSKSLSKSVFLKKLGIFHEQMIRSSCCTGNYSHRSCLLIQQAKRFFGYRKADKIQLNLDLMDGQRGMLVSPRHPHDHLRTFTFIPDGNFPFLLQSVFLSLSSWPGQPCLRNPSQLFTWETTERWMVKGLLHKYPAIFVVIRLPKPAALSSVAGYGCDDDETEVRYMSCIVIKHG